MIKWIVSAVWGILSFLLAMILSSVFATGRNGGYPYTPSLNIICFALLFLIGTVCFWGCRISAQLTEQKKMREQDRKPDLPAPDEDKAEDHHS